LLLLLLLSIPAAVAVRELCGSDSHQHCCHAGTAAGAWFLQHTHKQVV
jgi:hypothetical protein